MGYAQHLRETFPALDPVVGDLYLLEPHQLADLPERAPPSELAAVLHAYPTVRRYVEARHSPLGDFIAELLAKHPPVDAAELPALEQELLWEIGDLICYQKAPELYDERVSGGDWDLAAISDVAAIEGARVIDAGAGTGQVAFRVAGSAGHVFAVEPAEGMRAFIRAKAERLGVRNLYAIDGTLDAIPLPAGSADLLITSRAIGWHLEAELAEIERVVADGGAAVHLTGMADEDWSADDWHRILSAAGYVNDTYRTGDARARRYWKRIG